MFAYKQILPIVCKERRALLSVKAGMTNKDMPAASAALRVLTFVREEESLQQALVVGWHDAAPPCVSGWLGWLFSCVML